MTANTFCEIIQFGKIIYWTLYIFTMSKKFPVVLNFRCKLKTAECLVANKNHYYDAFYNTFNFKWCVSRSMVILRKKELHDLWRKKMAVYDAAIVNISTDIGRSWICYPFHLHWVLPVFSLSKWTRNLLTITKLKICHPFSHKAKTTYFYKNRSASINKVFDFKLSHLNEQLECLVAWLIY